MGNAEAAHRDDQLAALPWVDGAVPGETQRCMGTLPGPPTVTTSLPRFSGRCAMRMAAMTAAPEEMPTSSPSSRASRLAMSTDSLLDTCMRWVRDGDTCLGSVDEDLWSIGHAVPRAYSRLIAMQAQAMQADDT